MPPDKTTLYTLMLKSRLLEEAIAQLWHDGAISGEMHLGTGEEAINAGVVANLRAGDAMALDHRGTAPLLMRGVDPVLILREVLGHPGGLCSGMGGHMHMFSKELLAASSGIVGASGPAAAGFAMASQYLRPGSIAVAFFGEGSMNQGMMMESFNLASAWNLPVLFVCKDDDWSITVRSEGVTGGEPAARARGLGLPVVEADGLDVAAVWQAAGEAIESIRSGNGPVFLHTRCVHLEGHFLGYQLIRMVREPLQELPQIALPLVRSFLKPGGAGVSERLAGLKAVLSAILAAARDPRRDQSNDPLLHARNSLLLDQLPLQELEDRVEKEIIDALDAVFTEEVPV
jgi:acetoin:2,6-dichlorophenolindophenol oxidoreductase subunit alpha